MTQTWNTSGNPAPATTDTGDVYLAGLKRGAESALTHYAGPSDPSSGAPVAWGSAEVGTWWIDTSDTSNPKIKQWQLLTAPATYGWRTMRFLKTKWLSAPQAVTFTSVSPAAANVAYEDVDLSTLLDGAGVQDASQNEAAVTGVWVRFIVKTGAAETVPAATLAFGLAVRQKGTTVEQYIRPTVANVYAEATLFIPLDADEIFQFKVEVGGGTASFSYDAYVIGLVEEV